MLSRIDFTSVKIEKIIVHDIPKHLKDDFSILPSYSENVSTLTDGLRLFFKDKIVSSLSSTKALKISFDDHSDSPVSWLGKEIIDNSGDTIVAKSKAIAKHLFEIQSGLNTAGILVVIYGKVGSKGACILMKLERDSGAQLMIDPKTNSFNIEEVKNLMLTKKTRIFKVALLILKEQFGYSYDGFVVDHQVDMKAKKSVKTWFISFLGCKAYDDPKIATQKFYNFTKTFINTIEDEIDRANCIMHLNSYVQMNKQTIDPKEFADSYLKTSAQKNDYMNYLESKNFNFSAFQKDLTQIKRQLKIKILFENDILVMGKKGDLGDKVKLERLENGLHKAEIISKIKKID